MKNLRLLPDAGTNDGNRCQWKRPPTLCGNLLSIWISCNRLRASLAILLVAGCVLPVIAWADPSAFIEEGKQALEQRRFAAAVTNFSEALNIMDSDDPAVCAVLLGRAQGYMGQRKFNEAITDLNRALECQSIEGDMLATALRLRGTVYHRNGDHELALGDLTNSIKVYPQTEESLARTFAIRGFVLVSLGKHGRARGDFRKAIQLDPDYPLAYAGLGAVYLLKGKHKEAKRAAEKALSMNPDQYTARIARQVLSGNLRGDVGDAKNKNRTVARRERSPRGQSMRGTVPSADSIHVPFRRDGHVHVEVSFGDGPSYWFVLDTGATHTVMKRALLQRIKDDTEVKKLGSGQVRVADGSAHKVGVYLVKDVHLYNISLGDIKVLVPDLPLKGVSNLLGSSSLSDVTVYLDRGAEKAVITPKQAR